MLRINQQRSSTGAKSYFEEGLAREDYYTQDAIIGRFGGKGAERLGLVGEVQRDGAVLDVEFLLEETPCLLEQRQAPGHERDVETGPR